MKMYVDVGLSYKEQVLPQICLFILDNVFEMISLVILW